MEHGDSIRKICFKRSGQPLKTMTGTYRDCGEEKKIRFS